MYVLWSPRDLCKTPHGWNSPRSADTIYFHLSNRVHPLPHIFSVSQSTAFYITSLLPCWSGCSCFSAFPLILHAMVKCLKAYAVKELQVPDPVIHHFTQLRALLCFCSWPEIAFQQLLWGRSSGDGLSQLLSVCGSLYFSSVSEWYLCWIEEPFGLLRMPFCSLLAKRVSADESASSLRGFLCRWPSFFLAVFKILCHWLLTIWYKVLGRSFVLR